MNATAEFDSGLLLLKISSFEKSSLVFSVYHIAVLPSELMTLNFLLGDNFFDIFFYDTFSHCSVFKVQTLFGQIKLLKSMVGLARLELATSRLSGVRSNHLSYRPILQPGQTPKHT